MSTSTHVGQGTGASTDRPAERVAGSPLGTSVAERPRLPRTGRGGPGWRRTALGAVLPLLLLALWEGLVLGRVYTPVQLPSPLTVVRAAGDLWQRGLLQQYLAISTQRVLVGFAAGAAAGLVVGALVGLSRLADALVAPTIGGFRAVPSLAWVPLLLLYVGLGEPPKITLIAIGAFFPVYTTVASGLRHVDTHLVEAGRAYGRRGLSLLLTVQLPAVVPAVIAGLRLALAQSWLFLVAAELLGSSTGLGFLLLDSSNNGRTDRIYLAILTLAVLGKLSDAVLGLFERWALKRWA